MAGDQTQIVGQDDEACPGFPAQAAKRHHDLLTDRGIERGGRLVGTISFGARAIAIAMTTRCAMPPDSSCGKDAHDPVRFVELGAAKQGFDPVPWRLAADGADHLPADAHGGVERCHRVLEHEAETVATQGAQRLCAGVDDGYPVDDDRTASILASGGSRRPVAMPIVVLPEPLSPTIASVSPLATARSAPSSAAHRAVGGIVGDDEIADFDQCAHVSVRPCSGSSVSRTASPTRLTDMIASDSTRRTTAPSMGAMVR